MSEFQQRDRRSDTESLSEESLANKQDRYGNGTPQYSDASSQLSMEELDAADEVVLSVSSRNRTNQLDNSSEQVPVVEKSTLLDKAGELGLNAEVLGKSVQDLSTQLSDLSNPSSESTAWWQSLLTHVPYLGGLIEPDSGRMLLNLGDDGYALLTGDLQSIQDYVSLMNEYSANTALFWKFPLLFGLEPGVVREAETIMIGTRSNDLKDFLDRARTGSVYINSQETEAVPLLRWMALQAGEQSTDIEENENASNSDLVFAAAISNNTIFANSFSDGRAENLVESIESIYKLVETAPVAEQRNISEMLDNELLDIIDDDNRWGITDNDLGRMVDNIERLEQELQKQIDILLTKEKEAEETEMNT